MCELIKQGSGVREIAAVEHLSFRDIKKIKDKYFETDDDSAQNSKRSKALTMMEEGTPDLDIAIELNLSSGEIGEVRQEYLKLKGEDQLLGIYRRIGGKIEPFLVLYEMMNKEELLPEEAIWALQDFGSFENINKQFTHLTKRLRPLREEVDQLQNQKQELFSEIEGMTDKLEQLEIRKQNLDSILQVTRDMEDRDLQNLENTSEQPFGQTGLDWIGK